MKTEIGKEGTKMIFRSYLYNIKSQNNPYCDCGEIGTSEHMILNCSNLKGVVNISITKLGKYKELIRQHNLNQIITGKNKNVCKILFHYMWDCLHNKVGKKTNNNNNKTK